MTDMPKPDINVEVSAIGADDFGAAYSEELRLSGDGILQTRGGGDLGLYERLLTDWQVNSTWQQRRTAIVSREWDVEPGADDALSIQAAEYLKEDLKNLDFDRVCKKSLMAVFYGFTATECMYGRDGTKFRLTDMRVRKSRRFRFDKYGALRLVTKKNPTGVVMPENKFWLFQAGSDDDDDPYGLGLGHYLYWPVWLKRNAIRFWALFVEQMARGRFSATIPAGSSAEVRKAVQTMLNNLTTGGSAVISDNVAVELFEAMRNSGGDYALFCRYLDASISKIILSQTMTTDDGASLSQAEVHSGVKLDVIKTDADLQCESFNRGPGTWLTNWNFPGATPPKVWRNCRPAKDTKIQVERDKVLHEIGWSPKAEYIQEEYGDGFEPITTKAPKDDDVNFSEHDSEDEWRPLITPTVDALDALLDDCESLEEARNRLGEVAQTNPDAHVQNLARATFAAGIAGRIGAKEGDVDGSK